MIMYYVLPILHNNKIITIDYNTELRTLTLVSPPLVMSTKKISVDIITSTKSEGADVSSTDRPSVLFGTASYIIVTEFCERLVSVYTPN